MPQPNADTIAAIATPSGRGGVGVVRVSGPEVLTIAKHILGKLPKPRFAYYSNFKNKQNKILDHGLALFFPNPHSFTGEDVLELQGHGGQIVLDSILKAVIDCGARLANPGEFSERAFLNNKIDLVQAESIADLIDAQSQQAAQSALNALTGEFSNLINQLQKNLTHLRLNTEAAIDFPEEEIDFLADGKILSMAEDCLSQLNKILTTAQQGRLLRDGIKVVIAGKPNAGKSSLLNALSGQQSAIVTPLSGTTRDVLREFIQIDGMPMHIIDTAGLRETDCLIEQEGIKRAKSEIQSADRILLVVESESDIDTSYPKDKLTIIFNKIDLENKSPEIDSKNNKIYLSAKTGDGLDLLKNHLKNIMGFTESTEGQFIARRRHLTALENAKSHIKQGISQLKTHKAGELLAEECRLAQQYLSEITGEFTADDLLGEIFSSFCIGK